MITYSICPIVGMKFYFDPVPIVNRQQRIKSKLRKSK
jgi:hypothetical protein